jgi:integrase
VRHKQLEDYVEHLEKSCGRAGNPPSNRTINRYLDAVGKVLKYALKLELIPGLPAVPRKPDEGEDRDAVSWDAEDRLCAWMVSKGWKQEAFLTRVLAGTGMRAGELFVLRANQIETPEQRENTGWKLEKEQTKKKRARWIPIVPEAAKNYAQS